MPFLRRLSSEERADRKSASFTSAGEGFDTGGGGFATVSRYMQQPWQIDVARLCEVDGLARFGTAVVSDCCSMYEWTVERFNGKEWERTDNHIAMAAMQDLFRDNEKSFMWRAIWQWRSVGEGWFIDLAEDGEAPRIEVFAPSVVQPVRDGFKVLFRPNGTVQHGSAKFVPASKVMRFWNPDPTYIQLAQSPMRSVLADLRRYRLLGKTIDATARSAMLSRGIVWIPEEALGRKGKPRDEQGDNKPAQSAPIVRDYYNSAKRSLEQDGDEVDVASVAPLLMWYGNGLQAPVHMKFQVPFDNQLLGLRAEAAEAAGRGLDLPAVMVVNGGQGGSSLSAGKPNKSNHWSDLLVDRRFIEGTVNKSVEPVVHEWLTKVYRLFLNRYKSIGLFPDDPRMYRMSFDNSRVQINEEPDEANAMQAYAYGLLSPAAARSAIGFGESDAPSPGESIEILKFISKSAPQNADVGNRAYTRAPVPSEDYAKQIQARYGPKLARGLPPAPPPGAGVVATILRRINSVDQRTVSQVMGAIESAYSGTVSSGTKRTTPTNRRVDRVALAALLRRILAEGGDARLRAAEQLTGLTDDLIAATANSHTNIEEAVRLVTSSGIDPSSPAYRQAVIQLARNSVAVAAGGTVTSTADAGLSADEDARRRLDAVVVAIIAAGKVDLDWRWEHAFYGEPNTPYEQHVDLDGQVFGPEGPGDAWPGDHHGCTCELVPEVRV